MQEVEQRRSGCRGAEALSASDYLSLKHKDVLNAKNAGAIFCHVQISSQTPCPTDFSRLKHAKRDPFYLYLFYMRPCAKQ